MKPGDPKVLKLERQLNLVSFLLSARTPVPFSEIRGKVVGYDDDASPDAVEKRFDRDKADLRSIGVDIEYVAGDVFGRAGYVIDPQGYYLRETTLEPEDAMLLAVLQRTLGVVDDSLGRNLKSALAKLTIDSQLPEPLRASIGEQHLLTIGRPKRDPGRQHLGTIGEALSSRRRILFRYTKPGAEGATRRRVAPYGLGVAEGNWYVVGRDEDRELIRLFRLDRVRGKVTIVDKEEGAYDVPEDFDVADHIGVEEFRIQEGPEVEVEIELDDVATWLMERKRSGIGTLERLPDGRGLLRVSVRSEEGLYRWLVEYGQRARILAPKRMALAYQKRIEAARKLYADVPEAS